MKRRRTYILIIFLFLLCVPTITFSKNPFGGFLKNNSFSKNNDTNNLLIKKDSTKAKGYFNMTWIAMGLSLSDEPGFTFNFSTVNGYRFSKTITLGIGIGYCYMHNGFGTPSHYNLQNVPLFVDFKTDFIKKRVSPYWFLDIGATFPVGMKGQYDDLEILNAWPGPYAGTGFGIRVYVHKTLSLNFFLSATASFVGYESKFPSSTKSNPDDSVGKANFLFGIAIGL
jgi:hypothetical protein